MCRSRRELSNEYLLAKIGVDTAENEFLQVSFNIIQYYSIVSLLVRHAALCGANVGILSGAEVYESCRSRRESSNELLVAKCGVDTAENEPLEVCQKLAKN